ncbi:MAG: universal stress protein [Hyphomicrobiaceae bacterium]
MKTALVACEKHDGLDALFAATRLLVDRFQCYVEGAATITGFTEIAAMAPAGAAPVLLEMPDDSKDVSELRDAFTAAMRSGGITEAGPSRSGASFTWRNDGSLNDFAFAARARIFDISILARPVSGQPRPRMGLLEATLFESGGPLLIVPPVVPQSLGERIIIGWNGSTETTRIINFSMPILARAKEIMVLTVDDGSLIGPPGHMLASHLDAHGFNVSHKMVTQPGGNAGPTILAEAKEFGADTVIKGAYTTSRLRQMIFGGATSHILWNADLPILMAH